MRKKVKETHEGSAADSAAIQTGTKKRRKRMLLILLLAVALLMPVGRYLLSDELEVTFHHLYSPKIRGSENTRLVVLSDLHNHEFGKDNSDLAEQIEALMPDLIIIAGDMVNSDDDNLDILTHLCDELLKIAPVYYGPGNHESHLLYEKGIPLEEMLAEKGVHVLINRTESVTIHKTPFLVGGLTTAPEGYEEYGEEFIKDYEKSDEFKLPRRTGSSSPDRRTLPWRYRSFSKIQRRNVSSDGQHGLCFQGNGRTQRISPDQQQAGTDGH